MNSAALPFLPSLFALPSSSLSTGSACTSGLLHPLFTLLKVVKSRLTGVLRDHPGLAGLCSLWPIESGIFPLI